MASPFNVFRKHQKVWLATLGLLAMIAFVILPSVLDQLGASGREAERIVVTSKYGNLTENQLQQMRYRRGRLITFLQRAVDVAGFDRESTFYRKMGIEQFFGNAGEQSTVDLWILVRRAKQLGMTISDAAISEFIRSKAVTDDRVTNQQFAQLYKNLKISEDEVFNALHDELLARQLQASFATSLAGTPPGLRWEYYQRLNRKVSIQAAAVKVADYFDQVADPGDEVLKAYFEQHKDQLPAPSSPEPGFRVPAKVAVEYVKVDYDKYTDATGVTDKEIEEYYLKHRDQKFVKPDLPGLEEDKKTPAPKDAKADEKKPTEKKEEKPAENPAAEKSEKVAKYQPLQQVREEIRQVLIAEKRDKAQEAFKEIDKSLQPIRSAVSQYQREWKLYRASGEEGGAKEPKKPDFTALANQHDFTFSETGLISAPEFADLDVGRSLVEGQQSFINYVFSKNTPPYGSRLSRDMSGDVYLFWKTDSSDERVPEFEDKGMREQVLASWKTEKARVVAQQEAEKLAAEARKSKKTLAEAIGVRINVYESGLFTWVTRAPVGPQGQSRLMISDVAHVDRPGEEFMRAVYDLEIGQVGTAMNRPQTAVYVIQLQKTEPGDKVLWVGFRADPYGDYTSVASSDQMQILNNWIEGIRTDAGLKWERKPVLPTATD